MKKQLSRCFCVCLLLFASCDSDYQEGKLVWKKFIPSWGGSFPAVYDGRVYITKNNGVFDNGGYLPTACYLICLDAKNGLELWRHRIPQYLDGSPVVINGYVYVSGWGLAGYGYDSSNVHCINAARGTREWSSNIINRFSLTSVTSDDTYLYVGSDNVYKINIASEQASVLFEIAQHFSCAQIPVVRDGRVYFGEDSASYPHCKMYCAENTTGDLIWVFDLGDATVATETAVAGGKVFVGCTMNNFYCLDAATGRELWSFHESFSYSSPVVANNKVYVGGDDSLLYCLDADTGEKIWEVPTAVSASPAVTGGYIYFCSGQQFNCLNAETGEEVWHFETDTYLASSPAVADGYVYFTSTNGIIYCVQAAKGDIGNWPMYRGNPGRTGAYP